MTSDNYGLEAAEMRELCLPGMWCSDRLPSSAVHTQPGMSGRRGRQFLCRREGLDGLAELEATGGVDLDRDVPPRPSQAGKTADT